MNPLRALFLSLSRMPPAVMLLIIVGLAVVVTMMVTGKMSESQAELERERAAMTAKASEKVKVVYTTKDIPEGATIGADALEEKDCEVGKVPADALQSSSYAVGRIAKYGIPAGQIMSQHDMAPVGVSVGFESKIKEGQRAITFAVDNQSGVAGFVAPGSHCDIMCVVGNGRETKAAPILSDVEVAAVGTVYQKSSGSSGATPASSVTVSVNPEDASKLIKAVTAGKLYLTLRNEKDRTPVAVTDVVNLFEKPPVPRSEVAALPPPSALPPPPLPGAPSKVSTEPTPPPPPPLHEIELWSGSKKETLSVPKN
jgi:pilus assembly protein CpaB